MAKHDIKNKIVAFTGNNEVGYGTEGASIAGVVISIESAGPVAVFPLAYDGIENSATYMLNEATKTALGITGDFVVSVKRSVMVENVKISATASKQPTVGGAIAVDGTGGVVKLDLSTATVPAMAIATAVDTTAKTATIQIV